MLQLLPTLGLLAEEDPSFFEKLAPILVLLVVVGIVISRLPRVELGTTATARPSAGGG